MRQAGELYQLARTEDRLGRIHAGRIVTVRVVEDTIVLLVPVCPRGPAGRQLQQVHAAVEAHGGCARVVGCAQNPDGLLAEILARLRALPLSGPPALTPGDPTGNR